MYIISRQQRCWHWIGTGSFCKHKLADVPDAKLQLELPSFQIPPIRVGQRRNSTWAPSFNPPINYLRTQNHKISSTYFHAPQKIWCLSTECAKAGRALKKWQPTHIKSLKAPPACKPKKLRFCSVQVPSSTFSPPILLKRRRRRERQNCKSNKKTYCALIAQGLFASCKRLVSVTDSSHTHTHTHTHTHSDTSDTHRELGDVTSWVETFLLWHISTPHHHHHHYHTGRKEAPSHAHTDIETHRHTHRDLYTGTLVQGYIIGRIAPSYVYASK